MNQTWSGFAWKLTLALLLLGPATGVVRAQAPGTPVPAPAPAASPATAVTQPAVAAAPIPPDKVVLKVGDQQFTKAQIDNLITILDPRAQNTIAAKGKKSFGDWYTLVVAFSQRAEAHHLNERPDFIARLAYQKKIMEAQAAEEEINRETKVEPVEIQKYYEEHAANYDAVTVRQILVRVKPTPPPTGPGSTPPPTGTGLTADEAKTRAEAIRKAILAGTDIKKVSEDFKAPGIVIIEPEPRSVRRGSMQPNIEKAAFALKDGDVSEPMEIPGGLVMVQVSAHSHMDLKAATPDIERALLPQKLEAAKTEVRREAPVWMDDQYFAPPPGAPQPPTMGKPTAPKP